MELGIAYAFNISVPRQSFWKGAPLGAMPSREAVINKAGAMAASGAWTGVDLWSLAGIPQPI